MTELEHIASPNSADLIWLMDGRGMRLVRFPDAFPGQPPLKKSRRPGPLRLTSLGDYSHDGVPLTRLDLALLFGKELPLRWLHFLLHQLAIGQDFINNLVSLIQKKIQDTRRRRIFSAKGRAMPRREPKE